MVSSSPRWSRIVLTVGSVLVGFFCCYFWFSGTRVVTPRPGHFDRDADTIVLADIEHPCGPTCVALVTRILGRAVPLDEVTRLAHPDGLGRNSLSELASTLRHYGLHSLALRLPATRISDFSVPSILHWKGSHFVVAIGTSGGNVLVLDPPYEPREMTVRELSVHYTGALLLVHRDQHRLDRIRRQLGLEEKTTPRAD